MSTDRDCEVAQNIACAVLAALSGAETHAGIAGALSAKRARLRLMLGRIVAKEECELIGTLTSRNLADRAIERAWPAVARELDEAVRGPFEMMLEYVRRA